MNSFSALRRPSRKFSRRMASISDSRSSIYYIDHTVVVLSLEGWVYDDHEFIFVLSDSNIDCLPLIDNHVYGLW